MVWKSYIHSNRIILIGRVLTSYWKKEPTMCWRLFQTMKHLLNPCLFGLNKTYLLSGSFRCGMRENVWYNDFLSVLILEWTKINSLGKKNYISSSVSLNNTIFAKAVWGNKNTHATSRSQIPVLERNNVNKRIIHGSCQVCAGCRRPLGQPWMHAWWLVHGVACRYLCWENWSSNNSDSINPAVS